jgi:hypothetical protein
VVRTLAWLRRKNRNGEFKPRRYKGHRGKPGAWIPFSFKKLLLEVIAWQPVPQPGRSAVALAEAEGLPESSRGSSASEPPGSRPETDCTPGRGARATQPETIHLRRSFFLNQHPQGVPALCLCAFVVDFPRCRLPLWSSGSPVSARPPVRPGQGQSKPVKPVPVAKHPRTENRDPKPKTPKQVKVGQAQSSLSRP